MKYLLATALLLLSTPAHAMTVRQFDARAAIAQPFFSGEYYQQLRDTYTVGGVLQDDGH